MENIDNLSKKQKHILAEKLLMDYTADVELFFCVKCESRGYAIFGDMMPHFFYYCEKCQEHYCCDNCKGDYDPESDSDGYLCHGCRP